jgi:hypothetical protein
MITLPEEPQISDRAVIEKINMETCNFAKENNVGVYMYEILSVLYLTTLS